MTTYQNTNETRRSKIRKSQANLLVGFLYNYLEEFETDAVGCGGMLGSGGPIWGWRASAAVSRQGHAFRKCKQAQVYGCFQEAKRRCSEAAHSSGSLGCRLWTSLDRGTAAGIWFGMHLEEKMAGGAGRLATHFRLCRHAADTQKACSPSLGSGIGSFRMGRVAGQLLLELSLL
jgi:hypothetical protein